MIGQQEQQSKDEVQEEEQEVAKEGQQIFTREEGDTKTTTNNHVSSPPERSGRLGAPCAAATEEAAADTTGPVMIDTYYVNKLFRTAAHLCLAVNVSLITLVYTLTPSADFEYLPDNERLVAAVAFLAAGGAASIVLLSFLFHPKETGKMSGIVYAGLTVMGISMLANGLMAFGPTVVKMDPVIQSRVFLIRWCEWIPCAGLMTFLVEAIHIPRSQQALRTACLYSASQSVSCLFGLAAPYFPGTISWGIGLVLSFVAYFPIFPRLHWKYKLYRACRLTTRRKENTTVPTSFLDMEHYHRLRFAFHLMLVCAALWTLLVVVYLLNAYAHLGLPEGHVFRPYSLAMMCDGAFDVLAKAFYMRYIVAAHKAVFFSEGLAERRLLELRHLMSALWGSSSDLIILSVQHEDQCLALFSPGWADLLGTEPKVASDENDEDLIDNIPHCIPKALVLNLKRQEHDEINDATTNRGMAEASTDIFQDPAIMMLRNGDDLPHTALHEAYLIDSTDFSMDTFAKQHFFDQRKYLLDPLSWEATIVHELAKATWGTLYQGKANSLSPLDFVRQDGSTCHCEMKVMNHANNGMIAVVRDVTQRVKRFEAERKAEAETLKRQKESQAQTRFVRHEVKNCLLAGIELIDNIRLSLDGVSQSTSLAISNDAEGTSPLARELPSISDSSVAHLHTRSASAAHATIKDASTNNHSDMVITRAPQEAAALNNPHLSNARTRLGELDHNLHEVLDTVLAEAMARDVINEVYQPRFERVSVIKLLKGDRPARTKFPIFTKQANFPNLLLDPQLLRYVHRNAVSNACKYGEHGGTVTTVVSFHAESKTFQLEVINNPGHGHEMLKALGPEAGEAVFAQGKMLHKDLQIENRFISSGDGAWIAQKCARALQGSCSIRFEDNLTVFSFQCPSEPLVPDEKVKIANFEVPPGTMAVGIDDSKIQRKLISRIFDLLGVDEKNKIVIGEKPSDLFEIEKIVLKILETQVDVKILMLVDENLDYGGKGEEVVAMSGSRVVKDILTALPSHLEERVFCLVRSANDATSDLALYMTRAHGFFPKAPMNKARVQEIMAPLWTERFGTDQCQKIENDSVSHDRKRPADSTKRVDSVTAPTSGGKRRKTSYTTSSGYPDTDNPLSSFALSSPVIAPAVKDPTRTTSYESNSVAEKRLRQGKRSIASLERSGTRSRRGALGRSVKNPRNS